MTSSQRGRRGDRIEFYSWAQMALMRPTPYSPTQEGWGCPTPHGGPPVPVGAVPQHAWYPACKCRSRRI